jgi:BolA protein
VTVHDNAFRIGERSTRLARIKQALATLQPSRLELVDESHKHAGHAGARDGRGHFALTVESAQFVGMAPLARHRLVYAALGDLMNTDIHALSIHALAPT